MEVHNQRGYEKPAIIAQYFAKGKDSGNERKFMRTDKSDESIHISLKGPDADRMTRIKSIASSQDGYIFKKHVRRNMINYSDKFEERRYCKEDERPRYRENASNHAQDRRRPQTTISSSTTKLMNEQCMNQSLLYIKQETNAIRDVYRTNHQQ